MKWLTNVLLLLGVAMMLCFCVADVSPDKAESHAVAGAFLVIVAFVLRAGIGKASEEENEMLKANLRLVEHRLKIAQAWNESLEMNLKKLMENDILERRKRLQHDRGKKVVLRHHTCEHKV